jgi:DNA mismatch endonuclease, patch repair protein
MIDVVDRVTRSRMMAGIRGKDTKPELDLRRALHRKGLRYRLHVPGLPGRPDIVMPRHQAIIEIHGCFWHRHSNCPFCTTPASNSGFWKPKFAETIKRDKRNLEALWKLGWRVAVVWECSIKEKGAEAVSTKLAKWLQSKGRFMEISSASARTATRRLSTKK